jgi:chromosomal replication initiation ATPase DnaA
MSEADIARIGRVRRRLESMGAGRLLANVSAEHGVSVGAILGHGRHLHARRARHRLWALVRHSTDLSYGVLTKVFEVDHNAIFRAVRRRERELEDEQRGRAA